MRLCAHSAAFRSLSITLFRIISTAARYALLGMSPSTFPSLFSYTAQIFCQDPARCAVKRYPLEPNSRPVQLDTDGLMLLSAFACGNGAVDRVGIVTEKGKVYGAALEQSRVDELHRVEWDDCGRYAVSRGYWPKRMIAFVGL